MLQISRDHLNNKPLARCFQDPDELYQLFDRCVESGETYAQEFELTLRNGNGRTIVVDCRVSILDDESVALLVEMIDVTSRRRLSRDRNLKSQQDVGRKITRQLAHEIKNPLGGLRGAAQLLRRRLDAPDLQVYTDVIIKEADRLASLVDTLLGPGGASRKAPVNIHDVLEHVRHLVSADLGDRLVWHRDYDPSLPMLQLDRDQVIQAILNIVNNAAAASLSVNERGRIALTTRVLTNDTIGGQPYRLLAYISIEDDGPGIDAEIRDSVFYPLVTGKPDGSGIGLSLSQELINRHDGLIEFTSEPGSTVFQIRLPVGDD